MPSLETSFFDRLTVIKPIFWEPALSRTKALPHVFFLQRDNLLHLGG